MLNQSKEEAFFLCWHSAGSSTIYEKKIEEKLIKPLFTEKSIIFKKRNDHKLSSKKLNALAWSCLKSKLVGSITPERWFDMFCSLLLKRGLLLKKRPTDYNPFFSGL